MSQVTTTLGTGSKALEYSALLRGLTLVEILVDDDCETPKVLNIAGGIRIHVPTIVTYDEIVKGVGPQLTKSQADLLFEI